MTSLNQAPVEPAVRGTTKGRDMDAIAARLVYQQRLFLFGTGAAVGIAALWLMFAGNPPNMGFCIACFSRDIVGALGFHRASAVQYLRPEIIGIVLGAALAAMVGGEFKAKGGSAPLSRFVVGFFIMVGALVFLGCPLRMVLRLGGGDLNALVGLAGFVTGIIPGTILLRTGLNLGAARTIRRADGVVPVAVALVLLVLIFARPIADAAAGGPVFASTSGPGSMHAPILLSLVAGLVVGILAQRARLCFAGGWRDLILVRDWSQLVGYMTILVIVFVGTAATGRFHVGFAGQPIAHTEWVWNFLAMALVGLGSVVIGGCPLRQLVLAGSGDADAGVSVLGMLVGAATSHNFIFAAGPTGVPVGGKVAVLVGLGVVFTIGLLLRGQTQDGA